MIILPVRKKWLGRLLSGKKQEDYRDAKRYWDIRIIKWLGYPLSEKSSVKELLSRMRAGLSREVILQNGCGSNACLLKAVCSLSIGTCRSEWGAEPKMEYYRFHIKNISKSISGKE